MDLSFIIENALKFKIQNDDFKTYNNIFGIFVSIERLNNVHGCIGYWTNDYSNMTHKSIIETIPRISYSATFEDMRRLRFKKSIYLDLLTNFKIYYMKLPILSISDSGLINDNEKFDNNKYGVIVSNNYNKATYLPKVFKNYSWAQIKKSIIQKASITNNEQNKFYAYNAIINKMSLLEYYTLPLINFFNDYMLNNKLKEGIIRNIGTLYDLLLLHKFNKYSDKIKLSDQVYNIIKKQIYDYDFIKLDAQAQSFLFKCYYELNIENIDNYYKILLNNFLIKFKNNKYKLFFEDYEIIDSLSLINNNISLHKKLINKIINNLPSDIFSLNWISQYINKIQKIIKIDNNYIDTLENKILSNIPDYDSETNYLVVSLECLTALYNINNMNNVDNMNNINNKKIIHHLEEFFKFTSQRKNNNGIYLFKNNTYRLDITGHFISSINNLIKS
ncbi:AMMECR1 domain protein [Hokovirus HKV1]|uniref:AMMECR1 domain protein n=1 Tax=Hokovirus HKV1 TaxID=1977638 RepID=A0A1V0SFP7_9VIRU|nr:AMMECR1 domain protein [Hokovirus HKV1]